MLPHFLVEWLAKWGVCVYRPYVSLDPQRPRFAQLCFWGPVWTARSVDPVALVRFTRKAGLDGITFEIEWDANCDLASWEARTWPWLKQLVYLARLYGLRLFIVFLNDNVWQKPLLHDRLCYRLTANQLCNLLEMLRALVPLDTWIQFVSEWSGRFSVPTAVREWGYMRWQPAWIADCVVRKGTLLRDVHIWNMKEVERLGGPVIATGDTPGFLDWLFPGGVFNVERAAEQIRVCRARGISCSVYAARLNGLEFDLERAGRLWYNAWRG